MDTQNPMNHLEPVSEPLALLAGPDATFLPEATMPEVSDNEFEVVVRGALEAVGGTLLFKMKLGDDTEGHHAAAAAVGLGQSRQFLLLTLPTHGGQLKVETASRSDSPLARIAESYAGLMDVLKAAA